MKTFLLLICATRFLFSPIAQASDQDTPLHVTLTSDKAVYHLGEKILFKLTIENSSPAPLKVLVRSFNWVDLARMDDDYKKYQERAEHDPRWAKLAAHPNLADKLRAEGLPRPLGTLETLQDTASRDMHGFDVDGLDCGTGLKNGLMPAGAKAKATFSIGPRVTWGPAGVYRFVWRAASPRREKAAPHEELYAASNPVEITLTK